MSKRIFISYRREDTAPEAGRVCDRLRQLVSASNVFFDVDTIAGGEDFQRRLLLEIQRSDVVLAFIGKRWLEVPPGSDKARIWNPDDYVRFELSEALKRPIVILPVLVDGTEMARPELLPEDIRTIATRHALPLRHESFDSDIRKILVALLGKVAEEKPLDTRKQFIATLAFSALGSIAAVTLLAVGALAHFWIWARPLSASISAPATTLLFIVSIGLGAVAGLAADARRRRLRS